MLAWRVAVVVVITVVMVLVVTVTDYGAISSNDRVR